jgi:membrane dipeptidase
VRDREPVTVDHVVDHFDYVRKLVGIEHLAVGSDLDVLGWGAIQDPNASPPQGPGLDARYREHYDPNDRAAAVTGMRHPKRMFDLTEGLIKRGYSDANIKLILGGNAMRVLGNIWPKAAK